MAINRRRFLTAGSGIGLFYCCYRSSLYQVWSAPRSRSVMTVQGPVPMNKLGMTLSHEHVLVDFIGADKITRDRYFPEDAFQKIMPHLQRLQKLGCRSLVECTPAWLGRDPQLLLRLSRSSGMHILTNTGYYGAAENKFLPRHAFTESADALSARWVREHTNGIDDTAIRPGFIKIGVGGETLSDLHRKLVVAAARTHRATGLVIASHTGPAALAFEQLDILKSEGISPDAFIWVHAQNERTTSTWIKAAKLGCWVSLDGFAEQETSRYVEATQLFKQENVLHRLLISHDAGWYRPGEPDGGVFRGFEDIFRIYLPALRAQGISNRDIRQLLTLNPAEAFTISPRLL